MSTSADPQLFENRFPLSSCGLRALCGAPPVRCPSQAALLEHRRRMACHRHPPRASESLPRPSKAAKRIIPRLFSGSSTTPFHMLPRAFQAPPRPEDFHWLAKTSQMCPRPCRGVLVLVWASQDIAKASKGLPGPYKGVQGRPLNLTRQSNSFQAPRNVFPRFPKASLGLPRHCNGFQMPPEGFQGLPNVVQDRPDVSNGRMTHCMGFHLPARHHEWRGALRRPPPYPEFPTWLRPARKCLNEFPKGRCFMHAGPRAGDSVDSNTRLVLGWGMATDSGRAA